MMSGYTPQPYPTRLRRTKRRRDVDTQLRQGISLYQTFNQFAPNYAVRVCHQRCMPPTVVDLGELVGLIYRSDKWLPGQPRTYIHRLQTPPRLVSNVEGTQFYIIGGRYRITARGIEG